ncbi:FAD binding domain-containing protein [Cladophialophora immunda]|nr:FAD binding domain-containing protein [Cladophialophora immunda]
MGVSRRRDVVIVGGSIAGLCVGVALKTLPEVGTITILERQPSSQLQDQGAGIRAGDEVVEFLQKYANAPMSSYGLPLHSFKILNQEGKVIIHRDVVSSCATTWSQLFRVLMLAFTEKSCDDAAATAYRYSCNVRDVTERDDRAEVHFVDDIGKEETLLADLVIGADGASSKVRDIMLPDTKRSYAGYVLFRGLVPVEDLSAAAMQVMDLCGTLCFNQSSQMLSYTVPASRVGPPDSHKLLNWGWYMRKTEEELAELMTDVNGARHYLTLPPGGMCTQLADEMRAKAQNELSPQFAEAVAKTRNPFVQVITDSLALENVFSGGKVMLLGDAAAGQRPHTASAVTQACLHAQLLRLHLQGHLSRDEWSREVQLVSSTVVSAGQELGPICLSETINPSEKARLYLTKFLAVQRLLDEKWKRFSSETK